MKPHGILFHPGSKDLSLMIKLKGPLENRRRRDLLGFILVFV